MDELQIHVVESLPFSENTYVVFVEGRDDCLVIDPGMEPESILRLLEDLKKRPAAILNTHGHGDHIAGNEAMKEAFPEAPLMIGINEAHLLTDANANLTGLFGMPIISPPADRLLREGEVVEAAGIRLEVLEIPGHSPGHIVYVWRGAPGARFRRRCAFRARNRQERFPRLQWPITIEGHPLEAVRAAARYGRLPGPRIDNDHWRRTGSQSFVGDQVRG